MRASNVRKRRTDTAKLPLGDYPSQFERSSPMKVHSTLSGGLASRDMLEGLQQELAFPVEEYETPADCRSRGDA